MRRIPAGVAFLLLTVSTVCGQEPAPGDAMLAEYFRAETAKLANGPATKIDTLAEWEAYRVEAKEQLQEMLGLSPWPEKTPLNAKVTRTLDHEKFTVEMLVFESLPGLYVTGNLYVPKGLAEGQKVPAILYVCGHGGVKKNGVSYGNKTHYQHHGEWFARNGYVCLTIDTIQLGELEGIHHGTHNRGMWWWNCRGYTPAGVECWNCVRALDYLETRPEVDATKFGVTGRSGGGAYSWWIAAVDERIKVAVPVAGITSLWNHIVDGCVEGHCDCMYMVNTYRWDYWQVAAMVAPRPLLISNSDKDGIFPLEGVVDVHRHARNVYRLYKADKNLGLQITEGPHTDTQELQIHAFHWFNRFLKGEDPQIEMAAVKFFEVEQLKVLDELPEDEITTKIHETFTRQATHDAPPENAAAWAMQRQEWQQALKDKSFRGWPAEEISLNLQPKSSTVIDGVRLEAWDFASQEHVPLTVYLAHRDGLKRSDLELTVLNVLDEQGWNEFQKLYGLGQSAVGEDFAQTKKMFDNRKWGMAYVAPRGIGPTRWNPDARKQTHIRRRFMLLGQTRDGMRVWDIRRAVQALRSVEEMSQVPLWLQAEREMSGLALYASLFEPNIKRLDLYDLPASHRTGPEFLNVLRYLDMPQAVAMAAENSQVAIYAREPADWNYPQSVVEKLGWDKKQLQLRKAPAKEE